MKSILLIEDDSKLSMALRLRLAHMNYSVHAVGDAVSAMDAAVKSQPNIILLDINLPGGDGFVVADRLRGHTATSLIPIIFMTASESTDLIKRAKSIPNAHFLQKPFDASQLQDTIDDCDQQ